MMIKNIFSKYLFVIMIIWVNSVLSQKVSQKEHKELRLGFNYGQAKQETFPFDSPDYQYNSQFYKLQINFKLADKRKWRFELNLEPAYYLVTHKLLNKYYVRPDYGEDYLEKREEFTKEKNINEYVLNIGFLSRYKIYKGISSYLLGSIGPMYSDTDTERMNAGFAFSDIVALGLSYEMKRYLFDFRYSLRHVSNANIRKPNNGYNSAGFELGITYLIN